MDYKDFFKKEAREFRPVSDKVPKGIDKTELDKNIEQGAKEEEEHTKDKALAKIIAKHHILGAKGDESHADTNYYKKLKSAGLEETEEDKPVLDVPNRINGISIGKIVGVGKCFSPNNTSKKALTIPPEQAKPASQGSLPTETGSPPPPLQKGNEGGKIGATPKNSEIEKNDKSGTGDKDDACECDEAAFGQPQQIEESNTKSKEYLRNIIKECLNEMGYGAYKVGGRSIRTSNDYPQNPESSVWNPEVTENKEKVEEASYKVVSPTSATTAKENKARTIQTEPKINEASYKVVSPTQARTVDCDHARKIQTEPTVTENTDFGSCKGCGRVVDKGQDKCPKCRETQKSSLPPKKIQKGAKDIDKVPGVHSMREIDAKDGNKYIYPTDFKTVKNYIRIIRKPETNEFVVAWYENGKVNDAKSYYTDDKKDAMDTAIKMEAEVDKANNVQSDISLEERKNNWIKRAGTPTYKRNDVNTKPNITPVSKPTDTKT